MNIIKKSINLVKSAHKELTQPTDRSPHWGTAQNKHLKRQPMCQCCRSVKNLQVHHIKPFHLFPELELVESNLITLCMDNDCHLLVGHGGSFKAYNPEVETDCKQVNLDINLLREVTNKAKTKRLLA